MFKWILTHIALGFLYLLLIPFRIINFCIDLFAKTEIVEKTIEEPFDRKKHAQHLMDEED